MNPNLFDFERTAVYTRRRVDMPQTCNVNNTTELGRGVQTNYFTTNRLEDSRSFIQNKKEGRTEIQNRISTYTPMPSAKAYPVFQKQDNNFFYNNMPQNTRLNEINSSYKF